jgi:hypothetical protein
VAHLGIEWLAERPDSAGADQWLDSPHRELRGYKLLQVDVIDYRCWGSDVPIIGMALLMEQLVS